MLRGFTILLLCQFAGETLSTLLYLPLPGPLVGLLLLLGWLTWRGGISEDVGEASRGLLRYFGFLYVPAGVGMVSQLGLLSRNWVAVVVALVVSTLLGLAVTGWLMQLLGRPEPESLKPGA